MGFELHRRAALRAVLAGATAAAQGACRSREADRPIVFAAASLSEAFSALARGYRRTEPSAPNVQYAFAGSQQLRLQIEHGARFDVFASAASNHAQALLEQGFTTQPQPLATARLVIVVPSNNPAQITRIEELPAAKRLVVGSPDTPIGRYTAELFERVRKAHGQSFVDAVTARIVSREPNVRLVRAKVALGEADAAIVYETDARTPDVHAIAVPASCAVVADYWIATRSRNALHSEDQSPAQKLQQRHRSEKISSAHSSKSARFVAYAQGPEGQNILRAFGFGPARERALAGQRQTL